uniref:Uncharacterized protein n=1 Tax=Anguilla anguilla TaxID=7936 RepID=A0A0E9WI80_ANGAN
MLLPFYLAVLSKIDYFTHNFHLYFLNNDKTVSVTMLKMVAGASAFRCLKRFSFWAVW